ncbi:Fructokinase [Enhygromyxa salina]|uniref:Fructokinase n=1 Tax=Enhygromyxa salina TaxID=215803 RepID=A0A2S9XRC5_9BACT|nr:ROK family protein [Enhygromyxa salina]PRP95414.1 Fructokinase [Enhygromyxa salina]
MRIGVDLGGTKIEALALGDDNRELGRRRTPTPRTYEATIAAVVDLVEGLEAELGQRGSVGVGHPGSLSPTTGLIRNANSTALNDHALDVDLGRALGRELRLANDANCFAMSEASDGAAAGLPSVFGVIIGTGVGGGLVIDGRLLVGANAVSGEWGHSPLPRPRDDERPGPRCHCGRRGCVESFLSGQGLVEDHVWAHGGQQMPDARAIVEAAAAGDPACAATIERYAERLARALAVVINLVDPHAIVLGGGLSNCAALYERVPELWTEHVFSDRVVTKLLRPKFGDSSGVRGAAWLWRP